MVFFFYNFTRGKCYYCSHCSLHEKLFFPQMFWKDCLSKKIALEYHLSCIIRKDGIFFFENMILFFRRKMKDVLSQKIHGNIFSVYSVKMVFLFPTNMILPFCQKSKDEIIIIIIIIIHLKMTFPLLLKKMIFILENMLFLLTEKLKMKKKFT